MSTSFDSYKMAQEFRFHAFLKETFGEDLYKHLIENGSDVYLIRHAIQPDKPSIDFQDHGHDFVLSQLNNDWQLTIKHKGQDAITNIVEVPDTAQPEDMLLTFHSLKAEMIIELEDLIFHEKMREERNREIDLPNPELLLPNTLIRLADWECQLILAGVQAGLNAEQAISRAKQILHIQLNREGGAPGDLSLLDKCKPSVDQK